MFLEILVLLATALAVFAWYIETIRWNYWKNQGIFQIPGSIPFEDIFMTKHISDIKTEEYHQAKGQKIFGSYLLFKPVLNVTDPDLLRNIFVKDFDFFVDRTTTEVNKMTESLTDQVWSRQISMLEGDTWKEARSTFSPIFTSGKMKAMKVFMDVTTQKLVDIFDETVSKEAGIVDLKDLFGRFTMDTIASCAFGVDTNSFSRTNPHSPFVKNASSLFTRDPFDAFKFLFINLPWGGKILSLLGISVLKPVETKFFYDIVKETLRVRREQNKNAPKRNDLIDLMIAALKSDNNSSKNDEDDEEDQFEKDAKLSVSRTQTSRKERSQELDEMEIVSTAFVILVAGYDTTSQVLSYAGYELALNPEVQRRLQEEVDAAYEATDEATLDYQTIQNLPYLDMVINETLRLHPALGVLERVCTKDGYKVPGTNVTLKNQDLVHIPVYAIHTDPKFYPDPMKFEPERFSKEGKATRSPYTFMGFGQGPRSCLGMRFALLEAKMGLAAVMREFDLSPCDKTVTEIKLDPKSVLSANIGGLWVKAQKREHN